MKKLSVIFTLLLVVACVSQLKTNDFSKIKVQDNPGHLHNIAMSRLIELSSEIGSEAAMKEVIATYGKKESCTKTLSTTRSITVRRALAENGLSSAVVASLLGDGDAVVTDSLGICSISSSGDQLFFISAEGMKSRIVRIGDGDTTIFMSPSSINTSDDIESLFDDVNNCTNIAQNASVFISNVEDCLVDATSEDEFHSMIDEIRLSINSETNDSTLREKFIAVLDIADSSATYWTEYVENGGDEPSAASSYWSVSGYVRDDNSDEGLAGVSVIEKNTSNGTTTDIDGYYSIQVSRMNAVLQYYLIGYEPVSRSVNSQSTINIFMSDTSSFDEIWDEAKIVVSADIAGAVAAAIASLGFGALEGAVAASTAECVVNIIGL